MVARIVSYTEGDVFAVPLEGDGGYGIGVVARASITGPSLGYFFGPRHNALPKPSQVTNLEAVDNVLVQRFGDLGLVQGLWPVIGSQPDWQPEVWPMPAFGRNEDLSARYLRVEYADDDPNSRRYEVEVSREEFVRLPEDGLAGFGFVEARLTRLLAAAEELETGK